MSTIWSGNTVKWNVLLARN